MQAIAAQVADNNPSLIDIEPPPPPAAGEVLCRTLQIGVCGTDREILASKSPDVPTGQQFLVLGHECMATVEQVGQDVTSIQPGDLVAPVVRRPKPAIAASHRVDMLSMGDYFERGIVESHGFACSHWLDESQYLFKVDPEIEHIAVFTEPLSVAEKAVNEALLLQQARLTGEAWNQKNPPHVLVTGMGPIAFAGVIAARSRQWPVSVYGRDQADSFRASLVTEFGATYIKQENPEPENRAGFDLILECTGSDQVLTQTAQWLNPRGVMCWLGAARHGKPKQLNLMQMMQNAILGNHLHFGSVNAAPRDFEHALRDLVLMNQTHHAALSSLITSRVSMEDALWHYTHREPQGIKTVVSPA